MCAKIRFRAFSGGDVYAVTRALLIVSTAACRVSSSFDSIQDEHCKKRGTQQYHTALSPPVGGALYVCRLFQTQRKPAPSVPRNRSVGNTPNLLFRFHELGMTAVTYLGRGKSTCIYLIRRQAQRATPPSRLKGFAAIQQKPILVKITITLRIFLVQKPTQLMSTFFRLTKPALRARTPRSRTVSRVPCEYWCCVHDRTQLPHTLLRVPHTRTRVNIIRAGQPETHTRCCFFTSMGGGWMAAFFLFFTTSFFRQILQKIEKGKREGIELSKQSNTNKHNRRGTATRKRTTAELLYGSTPLYVSGSRGYTSFGQFPFFCGLWLRLTDSCQTKLSTPPTMRRMPTRTRTRTNTSILLVRYQAPGTRKQVCVYLEAPRQRDKDVPHRVHPALRPQVIDQVIGDGGVQKLEGHPHREVGHDDGQRRHAVDVQVVISLWTTNSGENEMKRNTCKRKTVNTTHV